MKTNKNQNDFAAVAEQASLQLPAIIPTEIRLVAELAANPHCIPIAGGIVRPEALLDPYARALYARMTDLYAEGKADTLSAAGLYASAATAEEKEWIRAHLLAATPGSGALVPEYAAAVAKAQAQRRTLDLCGALTRAVAAGEDTQSLLTAVRAYQATLAGDAPARGAVTVREGYEALLSSLQTRAGGLPTGYATLDRILSGGPSAGQLVVIGARPSVGKTSVALDIARNMAASGHKIAIYSLEQAADELVRKLLLGEACGANPLVPRDFRGDTADGVNYHAIETAARGILDLPLRIDDHATRLDDILASITLLHSRGECDCAVIDYVQLVDVAADPRTPKAQTVAEATRQLKLLARELGIPIVVLSQLSRDVVKGGITRAPELSDLRDSGAIEQDADIVLMLMRDLDGMQGANYLDSNVLTVWVRKNRGGIAGNVAVQLNANETFTRFVERQELYERACAMAGPTQASEDDPGY